MLILKQTPTERIVMYGSGSKEHLYFLGLLERKLGCKSKLGSKIAFEFKGEDFWKDLVEWSQPHMYNNNLNKWIPFGPVFKSYSNDCVHNAKESGLSALSQVKGEYILIVRQGLK